jgi:DNA (cytosine-5)-methyltransferase 1
MNHKQKLLEIYNRSYSVSDIIDVDTQNKDYIALIGEKINTQKGVFTVLITLITHKTLYPNQDVRKHQSSMNGGFSGRTIDYQFITPTLKELGLPSMAESGWLTRSLEQPYPYNLDYNGKISDKAVKEAFLNILDFVEKKPHMAENILRLLLFHAMQSVQNSVVIIEPLINAEKLIIDNIIDALDEHFRTKYHTSGGSKLAVLAFFAIYQSLILEISRYKDCKLSDMGSHTASDRTSKTAGDIEIFKGDSLFEAIEIKLDKAIDANMVRIAIEKVIRYNSSRYYILSYIGTKEGEKDEIESLIKDFQKTHGCQIIVNGLLPTLKYYLRLITSLEQFVSNYSLLIETDKEIKKLHKEKWNELILKYLR